MVRRRPVPQRLLGGGLGRAVGHGRGKGLAGDGLAARVPVRFAVCVVGRLLPPVDDGGDRGRHDEGLQGGRGVGEGGVEDREIAADRGAEEGVDGRECEVDRRRRVDDGVHAAHGRVERPRGRDVGNHRVLVLRVVALERAGEEVRLGRGGPRRASHRVALLEELEADVCRDVPIYPGDEDDFALVRRTAGGGRVQG